MRCGGWPCSLSSTCIMLSLRFHLERKTGGLTRILERGRNAIETIVRMLLLQLLPTIRRGGAGRLGAAVSLRLALRRRRSADRRALCRLHLLRDRVAHRHSPQDERQRQRRQRQGDRFAAELRNRQILLRRGARSQALRSLDGALRGGERHGPTPRSLCSTPGRPSYSASVCPQRWCCASMASRPAPIPSAISS